MTITGALGSLGAVASEMTDGETCWSTSTRREALSSISFPAAQPLCLALGDGLSKCFLFQRLEKWVCTQLYLSIHT